MSAGVRERQPELQTLRCSSTGRDHTIYLIGDWSVRTLWKWWSTASGCSPGLRLGLGLATTSHTVWFVPLYHQAVLQTGLQNPPLQAAVIPTTPHMWGRHPKTSPSPYQVRDRAEKQTKCLHLAMYPSLTYKPSTSNNIPRGHAKKLFKWHRHAKTTITSRNFLRGHAKNLFKSRGHAKTTFGHFKLWILNLLNFPPRPSARSKRSSNTPLTADTGLNPSHSSKLYPTNCSCPNTTQVTGTNIYLRVSVSGQRHRRHKLNDSLNFPP